MEPESAPSSLPPPDPLKSQGFVTSIKDAGVGGPVNGLCGLELSFLSEDLRSAAEAAELPDLTRKLHINLDLWRSKYAVEGAAFFFGQSYPDDNLLEVIEPMRTRNLILFRREYVLALAELLKEDIKQVFACLKGADHIKETLGMALARSGRPMLTDPMYAEGRTRALDPLQWSYTDRGIGDDEGITKWELSLIQLERARAVLLKNEEHLGGASEVRELLDLACRLNRS